MRLHARNRFGAAATALAAAAFVLVAAAPASGQIYQVKKNGTGDFTDFQTALDTVPAGSTLMVHGTWQGRFYVRQSVTVVGLRIDLTSGEFGFDNAVLEVDAGPGSHVSFSHLDIALGPEYTTEGWHGINVWSAGEFVVTDSSIVVGSAMPTPCEVYTHNGDGIVVHSADLVSVQRSAIAGGNGWMLTSGWGIGCDYSGPAYQPRGGHGVCVTGTAGLLMVEDSILTGGNGSEVVYFVDPLFPPADTPCGGPGGHGLDNPTGTTYLSNTTLAGGLGGHGWTEGLVPPLEDWGADGLPSTGPCADLGPGLSAGEAVLGRRVTLTGSGFAPNRAALLFFSTALLRTPMTIRQGLWFLDWPFNYLGVVPTDGTGGFSIYAEIPADPSLSGLKFMLQAGDVGLLSDPEIFVPRPPM